MSWTQYPPAGVAEHSVVGDVRVWPDLASPQLNNTRDIYVYLPPSYAQGSQRYPVLYMHDGQNLFDAQLSFAGEWRVDETMEGLAQAGIAAIVVGLANAGEARLDEYSPFRDARHGGGRGDAYLRFLIDTVKPLIDRSFRTRPERRYTGIAGSSMGGLISLYGFFAYPQHFGFAGVFSPALWFAQGRILSWIRRYPYLPGRIYLDYGTAEGSRSLHGRHRIPNLLARSTTMDGLLCELLHRKGYRSGHDLRYVVDPGAEHNEAAWARRLPAALRFLLADLNEARGAAALPSST
jgi:predicted alpha/beta superfamily hydrolase